MTDDVTMRAVRIFIWCAIVAPTLLTLSALTVQLVTTPHVPDPVATHWGVSGAPNGFAPVWVPPLLTAVFGLGLPLLIAVTAYPGLRRGDRGASYRLLGALAPALSALMAVLLTGSMLGQVGLAEAQDAPSILPVMIAAFAAAIAAGLIAWFVQPAEQPLRVGVDTARALALAPGERAVWFGSATLGRAAIVAITSACLLIAGGAVVLWLVGDEPLAAWIATLVAIALVALVSMTSAFRVRIDDSGLTVVSVAGVPRFHVPMADIASVAVRDVNPMGEFGGWGVRSAPGRFGVVPRSGPALDIERVSGKRFVVGLDDDAVTAGALLEALRERTEVDA